MIFLESVSFHVISAISCDIFLRSSLDFLVISCDIVVCCGISHDFIRLLPTTDSGDPGRLRGPSYDFKEFASFHMTSVISYDDFTISSDFC